MKGGREWGGRERVGGERGWRERERMEWEGEGGRERDGEGERKHRDTTVFSYSLTGEPVAGEEEGRDVYLC